MILETSGKIETELSEYDVMMNMPLNLMRGIAHRFLDEPFVITDYYQFRTTEDVVWKVGKVVLGAKYEALERW